MSIRLALIAQVAQFHSFQLNSSSETAARFVLSSGFKFLRCPLAQEDTLLATQLCFMMSTATVQLSETSAETLEQRVVNEVVALLDRCLNERPEASSGTRKEAPSDYRSHLLRLRLQVGEQPQPVALCTARQPCTRRCSSLTTASSNSRHAVPADIQCRVRKIW